MVYRISCKCTLFFRLSLLWWFVMPVKAIGFSRISVSPFRFPTLIKVSVAPISNSKFIRPFFISLVGSKIESKTGIRISLMRSLMRNLMLTSGSRFSRPLFLRFFFAASVRGFFALALSLISFYFCTFRLMIGVSLRVLFRLLVGSSIQRPALVSFMSCFLTMCAKFLDGIYTCWFIGSGQWESVSVMVWPTVMAYFCYTVHSKFLSFCFIVIIIICSWGDPFYAFFCACIDSFLQVWIFCDRILI